MEQKPLKQKVALVTGSSRGLGKEIALCLANAGATVIINYNKNSLQAEEVAQQITAGGGGKPLT